MSSCTRGLIYVCSLSFTTLYRRPLNLVLGLFFVSIDDFMFNYISIVISGCNLTINLENDLETWRSQDTVDEGVNW